MLFHILCVALLGCDSPDYDVASEPGARAASEITIHRDEWGVPHIYGPTDASVVFGAGYAQAEDNWAQVEDNFIRALGRGAEVHGRDALMDDYLVRGMQIEAVSKAEYERAPADMRALYEAYASGLNQFLKDHPNAERKLLEEIQPWYTIALIRFKYYHNEFLGYAGLAQSQSRRAMSASSFSAVPDDRENTFASLAWPSEVVSPNGERSLGSNEWAISGTRTESGFPMLLINPHVSFFGLSTYWEVHLESEEGLSFSGLTRFGFMLPYMGNNAHHGWAYTDNYGDHGDVYRETFNDDGTEYAFGNEWRDVSTWTDTIVVDGEERKYEFKKTHHGPILGRDANGGALAVRLAKYEEGGWFEQWYRMMRASSFEEWRDALSVLSVSYMNTMYADAEGNIFYLYNHTIPRRNEGYNWSGILDGSDPGTEWDGYHSLEELPQILNPENGYLQNTNSTPFQATTAATIRRQDYPDYMVGAERDNRRAQRSRQVLQDVSRASLDSFSRTVWDTYMIAADEVLGSLFNEYDRLRESSPSRAGRYEEPITLLRDWNRQSELSSVATTLFVLWIEASNGRGGLDTLARIMQQLESSHGTWQVDWGEINRLQRPDAAGNASFDSSLPSVPVRGAPGWLGSVFTYTTRAGSKNTRYGIHGNSFVKVIEFSPGAPSKSLFVFGQSGDPKSPHYFDQAELYSSGEMKPARFDRAEIERTAENTYTLSTNR